MLKVPVQLIKSWGDKGSQVFANRDRLLRSWIGKWWLSLYEMQIEDTVSSYTLESAI